jgi:hypothetical protein
MFIATHTEALLATSKETGLEVNAEKSKYCISRPIRHTFSPKKCDLNWNCILYAEGKYLFPNLQIPVHLLVTHKVKTTVMMILVGFCDE